MARTVGIDFKFSGDATKAVAAFKQIAAAASAAGGDTAKAGKELERALRKAEEQASARNKSLREAAGGAGKTGAGSFLAGLADSLGLGTFADQFGGVENVLDGISTKAAVAATGAAALGAVLVKLGVDSFNTFKTVVEQVDAVADVTGSSAEEASKLVGVFKGVGIDATAGASAMAKLAKAVGTNEAGLLKYGIVVARNADGTANLNGTLLNVASAYQATTDPAERAALASAVFGKSWADMVDVLEKSRSKISELQGLAPGVTDEDIRKLEEYKQATAGFGQAWTDSKLGVGRQLISLTTAELERFTGVASVAGSIVTGDLGGAWDKLFNDTKQASTAFRDASDDLGGRMVAAALQASFAVRNLGGEVELASARAARAASVFAACSTGRPRRSARRSVSRMRSSGCSRSSSRQQGTPRSTPTHRTTSPVRWATSRKLRRTQPARSPTPNGRRPSGLSTPSSGCPTPVMLLRSQRSPLLTGCSTPSERWLMLRRLVRATTRWTSSGASKTLRSTSSAPGGIRRRPAPKAPRMCNEQRKTCLRRSRTAHVTCPTHAVKQQRRRQTRRSGWRTLRTGRTRPMTSGRCRSGI
jgi:hypothetical protein